MNSLSSFFVLRAWNTPDRRDTRNASLWEQFLQQISFFPRDFGACRASRGGAAPSGGKEGSSRMAGQTQADYTGISVAWWRLLNSWDGTAGGLGIGWHVLSSTICQSAGQSWTPNISPMLTFWGSVAPRAFSPEKKHTYVKFCMSLGSHSISTSP